jgi:exonuclease V
MRAGAAVHARLEVEVHDFRPVTVATEADRWGLLLWNAVQGLRSLRETGVVRELRVWGELGGCLVAGVVDELTTACPDVELEAALELSLADPSSPPPSSPPRAEGAADGPPRVYIVDTKTRRSATVPSRRWELEGPRRQLMLYHALLAQFGAGLVPRERVFAAYGVDGDEPFSDAFVADVLGPDASPPSPAAGRPPSSSQPSDAALVRELRTPARLWTHMQALFSATLPPRALSPLLTLSYHSQRTGAFIGAHSFPLDADEARAGLDRALALWRGEREPEGVGPDVEEAFKCRGCEFADGCAWRAAREAEAVGAARRVRG